MRCTTCKALNLVQQSGNVHGGDTHSTYTLYSLSERATTSMLHTYVYRTYVNEQQNSVEISRFARFLNHIPQLRTAGSSTHTHTHITYMFSIHTLTQANAHIHTGAIQIVAHMLRYVCCRFSAQYTLAQMCVRVHCSCFTSAFISHIFLLRRGKHKLSSANCECVCVHAAVPSS